VRRNKESQNGEFVDEMSGQKFRVNSLYFTTYSSSVTTSLLFILKMHSDSSATTLLYRRHQQRPKSTSRQHKIPNIRLGKKLGTGSFSEVFHGFDVVCR
jgi:hypothetical protein